MVVAGVGLGLLGAAYVLAPEGARLGIMAITAAMAISAAMVWFPETLIVGCLFAGRYSYEPRLALGDGPFSLNQLLLGAMLVLMIVHRRHVASALKQSSVRGLLLFVAVLVGWTTWTIGPEYGTEKVLRYLLVIVPAVIAGIALVHWRGGIQETLLAFWGFGLGLTAVAVVTQTTDLSSRTTALGSGPIVFARSAGLALLISILAVLAVLRMRELPRLQRFALVGVGALCAAGMLPTFVTAQSRGPVLALLVALAVYGLLLARGDWRRSILVVLIGVAAIGIANMTLKDMPGPSRYDEENRYASESFQARGWLLEQTLDLAMEHPLLGVGTGGWPVSVFGIDHKKYPHNFFAEIAAEQGIVVCTLVLILFFGLALLSVRDWSRAPPCAEKEALMIALCAYLYTLGTVQFSGDIVDNRNVWLTLGVMESARYFLARRLHSTHAVSLGQPGPVV